MQLHAFFIGFAAQSGVCRPVDRANSVRQWTSRSVRQTAAWCAFILGCWLLPCVAGAQPLATEQIRNTGNRGATFSTQTHLVLVPVAVTDRKGTSVVGLSKDDFTVWDDKALQQIVSFTAQDAPCSVGIVLDTSGSMKDLLRAAKEVVGAFLKASNPADEFFLLTVSSQPQIQTGITDDPDTLEAALRPLGAGGNTALYDTTYLALNHLRRAKYPQRALLVISDGMDNRSRYTAGELMGAAVEADAQIYTISVSPPPINKKPVEQVSEQRGSLFMAHLADRTGGINFSITSPSEAPRAATEVGLALRNQYVLGFKPPEIGSGKPHSIKVRVDVQNATAHSRNLYHADN
jgi:Ca-activated chloride channel family protein